MTRSNKTRMQAALKWSLALLFSASLAGVAAANAFATRMPHKLFGLTDTTTRLIVHYRQAPRAALKTSTAMRALSTAALVPLTYRRTMGSGSHVLRLPHAMTLNDAKQVARRLARDPNVLYAEPSYPIYPDAVPNDPMFHWQWALGDKGGGINMEAAWNMTQGSPDIVMAILDTGILLNHPEFKGRLVPGYNFISDPAVAHNKVGRSADPSDLGDYCLDSQTFEPSEWHGSHVAGIMGARAGNNIGIAGIAPRAMILPVRIMSCTGTSADAIDGLRWAAGLSVPGVPLNLHPARLINMSLGEIAPCPVEMQTAINEVRARGAVVVAAAGNDGIDASSQFPANCHGVITVAAVDGLGNKVSNSLWSTNYGQVVTISAPGEHILSSVNAGQTTPTVNNFGYLDGTSQAAPQVAGVLALMLSVNPHLTPDQLTNLLIRSRRPFAANASCAGICQAGMLDAYRAVLLVRDTLGVAGPPATPNDSGSVPALVVSAGPVQSVPTGQVATLRGAAHARAPATLRRLHWLQTGGPHVTLSDSYITQPHFVAPRMPATLVFQLTAIDSQGQAAGSKTEVRVTAATRTAGAQAVGANPAARAMTLPSAAAPAGSGVPGASTPSTKGKRWLSVLLSWAASWFQ